MCGFVAAVDTTGNLTPGLLARMSDAIVHRGPDEDGVWVSRERDIGLATRRLKIIDLTAGQQPMQSPRGNTVLAYNGELYNHAPIRSELEQKGWCFRTRCDTEVVLAAYEAYGERCLERFDGMFAFTIWDADARSLFFARDRVGKKPLYYVTTKHGYVFASEIKALLRHPDVSAEVDREALAHYMSFLVAPPPNTMFAGISKVPAAHCGRWSPEADLSVWRWWGLPTAEPKLDITKKEAEDRVGELFAAAVEKRMMSDVPIGVYLSGGIDSSANVAFMSRHSDEPLRTFSVAFAGEPKLNELSHAREVARLFGTDHHEVVLQDADVIGSIPALIHAQDEPIADPVCVPLLHLARETKRAGVTVVQIGEGSDESFFGYDIHSRAFRGVKTLRRLRAILPERVLVAGLAKAGHRLSEHKREFADEALTRGFPAPHGIGGLSQGQKERLLVSMKWVPAFDYLNALVGSGRHEEDVAALALEHEFQLRLPELLLMRVDKMTMAASVEARAPFLDHHLVEFAARLPLQFHWGAEGGKLTLRRALSNVLPESVLNRKKQGFGAPVWRWSTSLGSIARTELLREPIFEHLDEGALRSLLGDPSSANGGWQLWIVLNFALWHRHWIEGDDLRDSASFLQIGSRSLPAAAA